MFTFMSTQTNECKDTEKDDDKNTELEWFEAKQVLLEDAVALNDIQSNLIEEVILCSTKLLCIKASTVTALMSNEKINLEENLSLAEKSHSDLIPSKYEGGLKLWECTRDVAELLSPSLVSGKDVLDLGCGLGLLGILALKMGADSVVFQDYNVDVLRCATINNVRLNVDESQLSMCQFYSGDWASFADLRVGLYDLVVTSETIYNPDNHEKLHDTIKSLLRPGGIALIGAKSYYFGVGGSMKQFENLINEKNVFNSKSVWKCLQEQMNPHPTTTKTNRNLDHLPTSTKTIQKQDTTTGARQNRVHNMIPDLTAFKTGQNTSPEHQETTMENSQTCEQDINSSLTTPKTKLKLPPLNAKILGKDENINEFFEKNLEFYKEHMRKHYNFESKSQIVKHPSSSTPFLPELRRHNVLSEHLAKNPNKPLPVEK